jgi:hypothetical protein
MKHLTTVARKAKKSCAGALPSSAPSTSKMGPSQAGLGLIRSGLSPRLWAMNRRGLQSRR